ncbi:MAG: N utilization substance, B-like protein [SAR86 cluster bacterium SAR86B]|uniref:N utilization substance, B-like protein n=1 Tax=SAR86 cluster bacterium SAR86B TaxID=1123867 RepID=J4KT40_9GAMM|nr:MAG: N utilization substance, B-like protein [SAR86 cluster bacterium SAR86B]
MKVNFKEAKKLREILVQAVYQFLFNNQNTSEIYDQFAKEHQNKKINLEILNSKLKSIELNSQKINQAIDKTDFDISKIDLIDKAILYVAFEEIIFGELDHPVIIDEAIRLSKKFSNPDSFKFLNAIIDKYIKL